MKKDQNLLFRLSKQERKALEELAKAKGSRKLAPIIRGMIRNEAEKIGCWPADEGGRR